jgi:hypothetical protein
MSLLPDLWTVAVLSSRESWDELKACIQAVLASQGPPCCLEVVVNGNPGLAEVAAQQIGAETASPSRIRIWSIEKGDKANAFNILVHRLAAREQGCFFLDGYVQVQPGAFQQMVDALHLQPSCLAIAAVPTIGRSARSMRQAMVTGGGLHGNLFALAPKTMTTLGERDIRIPVGMYRTDATLGAMLSFGLDPSLHEWNPLQHICVASQATWSVPAFNWFNTQHVLQRWKRLRRQARGHLENMAVRHHLAVCRRRPELLGRHIVDVVATWKREAPGDFKRALGLHPLRWLERDSWPPADRDPRTANGHAGAKLLLDRA